MCRFLHVLTGPTAVGKTALALDWAEANDAEIVSCDASLFYRGMDIGTAKPSAAERARVPHHLIDVCTVRERMDVALYVARARAACEDIARRGRPILVTGGSGFYLKAFFGPVADNIAIPDAVKAEVAELEREAGLAGLVARLRAIDPELMLGAGGNGGRGIDLANPRRVARALERCLATGRTVAALAAEFQAKPGPFADWQIRAVCLLRPDEELRTRITERVAAMLCAGLVDETRRLQAEGIEENPSAASAIGYRETLALLRGELAANRLAAEIAGNTWRLVRKQKTWFRTQLPSGETPPDEDANPGTSGLARVLDAAEATAKTLFR